MTINGWDISNADAKQWNVTPGFHTVSNDSEWARGSPIPIFFANDLGFKPLTVTLLIKGNRDRQAILHRCSEILSHLIDPAELVLDDFDHKFFGILTKHTLIENAMNVHALKYNRAAKFTLEFNGYEYVDDIDPITATGSTTMLINNNGNALTPATITITPQIGASSLTITGICRDRKTLEDLPVTIRNLETGKPIVLDGETTLFTKNGALATNDIDIWAQPTLLPGENRITINNSRMEVKVSFRPRFM